MANDADRLVQEATAILKSDARVAVQKLDEAWTLVQAAGGAGAAIVAEELSRAWARRKGWARALHWARRATLVAPERKAAWAALGKTCELVALKTDRPGHARRTVALHRATATAFKRAAALATDREDKNWLLELARDAAQRTK